MTRSRSAPAGAALALPAAQATEKTIEFGFRGPTTLHDGEVVRFENEGFLVHMDIAFPVKNMKAAQKAVKDLKAGNEKAVEKLIAGPPVGFYGPLSHDAFMQETITAKPGIYVQACFMETQDKRDHTQPGDGADHQDHQVAGCPSGPVLRCTGAGPARALRRRRAGPP